MHKECNKNTGACGERSILYIESTINMTAFLPCSSLPPSFSASILSPPSPFLFTTALDHVPSRLLLSYFLHFLPIKLRILKKLVGPPTGSSLRCSSSTLHLLSSTTLFHHPILLIFLLLFINMSFSDEEEGRANSCFLSAPLANVEAET